MPYSSQVELTLCIPTIDDQGIDDQDLQDFGVKMKAS